MRTAFITQIKRGLIIRFKKREAVALSILQSKNKRFFKIKSKTFRTYVQSMFCHARIAEIILIYN